MGRNAEGYPDPTASKAIRAAELCQNRYTKTIVSSGNGIPYGTGDNRNKRPKDRKGIQEMRKHLRYWLFETKGKKCRFCCFFCHYWHLCQNDT